MEKFIIVEESSKYLKNYKLTCKKIQFRFKSLPEGANPISWIREGLVDILAYVTEGLEPQDKIGFTFCCPTMFTLGDAFIPFTEARHLTVDYVWDRLTRIFQSTSAGIDTETFCLEASFIKNPMGQGRPSTKSFDTYEEECRRRQGILVIKNDDNLCLPRALVVAMGYIEKSRANFKSFYISEKQVKNEALKLCTDAGVTVPLEGCGIDEIQQFQRFLRDTYNITVYDYKSKEVMFLGPKIGKNKINLLYHEHHFNVITSLTAAFACTYYCEECHVRYSNKEYHRCSKLCPACFQAPECERVEQIKCLECLRMFRSSSCFDNHKAEICNRIKICTECHKVYRASRQHYCGEIFCQNCKLHQPQPHYCFIQVDKTVPKTDDTLYIFFDLETRQEKKLEDGSFLHEPNLCAFKTACTFCMNTKRTFCYKCGPNLEVLRNDPIENFITAILNKRKLFKSVIVLAHYGSGFDMQFIFNHLITKTDHSPDVIMTGTKIILMTLCNVKFLDSFSFLTMPLSKLPDAFDLGNNFKKGYFPHLFNTKANENYIGPMPDISFYNPDGMMEKERVKFLKWYEENKDMVFNFQRDLVDYCISDVEILMEACLKFRQLMIETSNVCPFSESCTIPGACNKIFRRNFLKENTIAIIPKNGYRCVDNQSKIATQWLIWEEKQRGLDISCAVKQRETCIKGRKVDGFCEETKEIFEFHGCWYHGCQNCFIFNRDKALTKHDTFDTFNYRFESTQAKIESLKSHGYTVKEMWECDFRRLMAQNPEIQKFTESHPLLASTPLNPRESFYGGRTGNCKTYFKAEGTKKAKYVDVCSLYPWVCKYGKFPIGHPQIFVGEECKSLDLNKTDGLIKCKVLPPQDLYHPVLPQKMSGKLMFVLCRTCGESTTKHECIHSDEDRALQGTWVVDEVLKALEKGYKLLEINEIWKYEVEAFKKERGMEGLFTSMMNKFLKIKQEASGWPGDCKTEEEKDRYIEDFMEKEGIQLEYSKITKNPGLRSLAKLILNSFWGKFGQLERKPKTKVVNNYAEYFETVNNPSIEISRILTVDENVLIMNYIDIEEAYDPLPTVNVAIAAYVTAQARLKLYSYLENLEGRVLYYDTDSVIYIEDLSSYNPPVGRFIGDMTDELEDYGPGSYIKEFVSGGPKNYAYLIQTPTHESTECKIKGFKLNYATKQLLNFETIKNMVLGSVQEQVVEIPLTSLRRTATHDVVTRKEVKKYRLNSTKRRFLDNFDSVPYGFKKLKGND